MQNVHCKKGLGGSDDAKCKEVHKMVNVENVSNMKENQEVVNVFIFDIENIFYL